MREYNFLELKKLTIEKLKEELKRCEELNFINFDDEKLKEYIEIIKKEIKIKEDLSKNSKKMIIKKSKKKDYENER